VQKQVLLDTMQAFNDAANTIAEVTFASWRARLFILSQSGTPELKARGLSNG
jgi:hypothetical protein